MNVYFYEFTLKTKNFDLLEFLEKTTSYPDGFHRVVSGKRREIFIQRKKNKNIFYGLIITRTGKKKIPTQIASGSFKSQKLKFPEIGFNLFMYDVSKEKGIYSSCTGTLMINTSSFLWTRMLAEYDSRKVKELKLKSKVRKEKDKPNIECKQIFSDLSLKELVLKFKQLKRITLRRCILIGGVKHVFKPTENRPFDFTFPVFEHDNVTDLINDIENNENCTYDEVAAFGKTKDNTDKTFYSQKRKNFEYSDYMDHERFIELMENYDPTSYTDSKIFNKMKKHLK